MDYKRVTGIAIVIMIMVVSLLAGSFLRPVQEVAASGFTLFEGEAQIFDHLEEYVPDQIIVRFKKTANASAKIDLNESLGTEVLYTSPSTGFEVLQVPEGQTVGEMVEAYSGNSLVASVQPNYIYYITWSPNDPIYSYQWHFDQINLEAAWDLDTDSPNYGGDPDVVVAVIDTGVAYETYSGYVLAPDLADTNFWVNAGEVAGNSVDDDSNGYVDDINGWDFVNDDAHPNDDQSHGTHVCGTISQSTNDGYGVAGIAFNTTVMPLKVMEPVWVEEGGEYYWSGTGDTADIAEGIIYAVDNGADVINLSIGNSSPDPVMESAVAYAYNAGVVVVASSGNSGDDTANYPASYDDYVISVGATRYDETRSYYSSYGEHLDIVAPGGDVTVDQNGDTYADGVLQQTIVKPDSDDYPDPADPTSFGWYFYQGTSMASPHVAGVAALILAEHSGWTPDQVRQALENTAEDKGDTGWDEEYGWGLIDAAAAIAYVNNPPTVTSVDPVSGHQGQTLDNTITGTNFTGATGVSFGAGITVSDFDVDSDTQITADITIAGGAATGTRDVSVTTPAGTGTLTGGFTVNANTAPVLSSGEVSPTSGDVTTEFTYSVTYTDADNDAPDSITVSIDGGGGQAMTVKTGEDGDFTNGEVYEYSVSGLAKDISHTFQFAASDGVDAATGDTTSHNGPGVSNNAPVLSGGEVNPTSGYVTTDFTYSVTYTDADNDAPDSITVSIDGGGGQPMTVKTGEDGDFTNGEVYEYSVSGLAKDISHTFQFTASDGTDPATGDTTSHSGPTVANSAPVLSGGEVNPTSGDVTTEFTYSVTYTDADNDAPDSITVSIDGGGGQAMTVKTDEDGDFTNGEVYEYSVSGLSPGSHTFQFAASDGTDPATGDTTSHNGPGVSNNAPVLSGGEVNPASGYVTTDFTYSVTYTDADNDAPDSITVSIDGGAAQAMTVKVGEDGDYTNGEVYEYSVSGLSKDISHTFQFTANDGIDTATGDTASHSGPTVSNSLPTVDSVEITPDTAYTDDDLTATPTGWDDADGDTEGYQWQWQKDSGSGFEVIVGADTSTLASSNFVKGDQVKVICTPFDGTATGTPVEDTATILNSPPGAPVVDVTPDSPTVDQNLVCSVITESNDPDGDTVTYSYEWFKDDVSQGGLTTDTVDSSYTADNETWRCKVTPNDGTEDGDYGQDEVKIGAPYLSEGQVSPTVGTTGSRFNYSVVYTHGSGVLPTPIEVSIDGGAFEEMTEEDESDTDCTDGKLYEYYMLGSDLGVGTEHTFQFAASDGTNDAIGDIEIHDGPTVNKKVSGGGGGAGGKDVTAPRITDILVSNVTKTGADVTWVTQEKSTSQVEYRASPSQLTDLDEELVLEHYVQLTDLNPATTYYCRVMSQDKTGNISTSEEVTFKTLGTPAAFTVSDLAASHNEVEIGDTVTISFLVTNTGDAEGTYQAVLKAGGEVAGTKAVTLAGGASQTVTFDTSPDSAGSCEASIEGLSCSFVVKALESTLVPQTPQTQATLPPSSSETNWWLIGGIIAAVCVAAGLAAFFMIRRRQAA